ncbi:MAG TPA: DUF4382 domain-containing protein [Gemmatimonadaceae bacterium]|nr:DUF4382 domain-containing protein [Gemmatimonadaceae bacterium]
MLSTVGNSTGRLRPLIAAAAIALGAIAPLTSCSDSTSAGNAKLSILLTDAPGDVKAAVVTIDEIYLQGSGRIVLMDQPVTTDLLTLANSTAELVKDAVVPAGSYGQLRFVVSGAYIEVENGDGTTSIYATSPDYAGLPAGAQVAGTLQTPSFDQSGLKVNLPGGALHLAAEEKILLVDFDVSQSFGHEAGGSDSWVMHPVLKATDLQTTGDAAVTLSLGESVTLPTVGDAQLTLGDFEAVLTASDMSTKELAFTDDDGDGTFEADLHFLTPGDYTVTIAGPAGVTFATDPASANITVGSGGSASAAFTLTSASVQ